MLKTLTKMKRKNFFTVLFISMFVFVSCNNDDNEDLTKSIVKSAVSSPNKVVATYNRIADTLVYAFDMDSFCIIIKLEEINYERKK